MQFTFSLDEIELAAQKVIDFSNNRVILFNGEMGAGKTTLIKQIARLLGVSGTTSSPTFSLVNEYPIDDQTFFYHFDMYRLTDEEQALDIGIEEYLYSGHWCMIEWPEKITNLIPPNHTLVNIKLETGNRRSIEITSF